MKPLDHITVLDLSRVLSGPFCTMSLADMGARVLKVEQPGTGDDTRGFGPPFVNGESTYFMSVNRNKESLTLNLKSEAGQSILWRLIEKADVLVENFRAGVLDRLGFTYEACAARNSGLIYCSISGFGHSGLPAFVRKPGYDLVIQGLGGVQHLTGAPDGPPYKVGTSIADLVSGMLATQGILLAIIARTRTGRGQKVDISMLDGQVSLLTYQAGIYFATGRVPGRMGNRHPSITPYECYAAADGFLNLAVGNDSLWRAFCTAADVEPLARDPRFLVNRDRVQNREALEAEIGPLLKKRTVAEWIARFDAAGVPCGPVLPIDQVLTHPQVEARGMVVSQAHPVAGRIRTTGVPIKLSDTPGAVGAPPPLLGEHTSRVLEQVLGLGAAEIAALKRDGAI